MTAVGRPNEQVAGTVAPAGVAGGTAPADVWGPGPGSQAANGGTSVALRDLCCRFGSVQALDRFSLDIGPGEFVALLGPSGCGKTTALRILAGFESANSGQVLVDGHDIQSMPAQRRGMGMVFQSYSLFPNMTVLQNVAYGLRLRKVGSSERKAKAMSLLDMVELKDRAQRYPHQLSGGQQQRVALARALAIEPRVLLLDEPLSALDAKVRVQLREQIRALQRRLAITTVFVTHDQDEALSMADRVAVMRQGRLEQVAPPAELYSDPQTAFVAEFVGTMNRLPAKVVSPGKVAVLGHEVAARGAAADIHGRRRRRARTTGKPGPVAGAGRQRDRHRSYIPGRPVPCRRPALGRCFGQGGHAQHGGGGDDRRVLGRCQPPGRRGPGGRQQSGPLLQEEA